MTGKDYANIKTFDVISHLSDSVDSIYDFSKAKLYRYRHFRDSDSSYFETIKENLLEISFGKIIKKCRKIY